MRPSAWGIVTARGGSKSIPLKNLAPLHGRPLLDYVVAAAQGSGCLARILCSTESEEIAHHCLELGIEVHRRPSLLAADDARSLDVVLELARSHAARGEPLPDVLVLLEPTSPFLLPEHVGACLDALAADPRADSAQTITAVAPNAHAFNQRRLQDGLADFVFAGERERHPNKQSKPVFYQHGNARATRTSALLAGRGLFGARSIGLPIPRIHAFDVDGPDDMLVAECLLSCNAVPGLR